MPAKGHSPAGIYVQTGSEHLLFDAGAGSLQRLRQIGVTLLDLDRVFLTHFHVDHCLDIVSILFAMRLPNLRRRKALYLYGPRGLKRLIRGLDTAFNGWLAPKGYRLIAQELEDKAMVALKRGRIFVRRVNHASAEAVGYRLTVGTKSLAYSGDTDMCHQIGHLGKRADCLILECSTRDDQKVEGHLTPSECGYLAADSGCRRLVLTHFYPVFRGYDIRRRVRDFFHGPLTLARDFTTFRV